MCSGAKFSIQAANNLNRPRMDKSQRKERVNRYTVLPEMDTENPRKYHAPGLFHSSTPGLPCYDTVSSARSVLVRRSRLPSAEHPSPQAPPQQGPAVWHWVSQNRANAPTVFGMETLPLKAARASCRFQGNTISCFTGKSTLKRSIENWHFHPSQTHSSGIFSIVFTGSDDKKQICILLPWEKMSDSTSVPSFPQDQASQYFLS